MPRRPSNHVDDPVAVGGRIREARTAAGLKQRDLTFEGCTPAYLSRVEAGQRIPSLQILTRLAERLGTTAEFLATGKAAEPDRLLEAELAARTGETDVARRLYGEAADGDSPVVSARAKAALGRLEFDAEEHERAIDLLNEALAEPKLPQPELMLALETLGKALALLARFDESCAALDEGLAAARRAHDRPAGLRFAVLLANVLIDRGNPERAEELLASIIDDARATRDPVALANLYWSQARLHLSQRRQDLAARYARMAHATAEATEHTLVAGRALTLLAHISNDRGNHAHALAFADDRRLGDMYRAIGEIHESEGRPAEALEFFRRALDVQARTRNA